MLRWGRIEVTGGFLLVAATLYYLDDSGMLLWAAAACLCHEAGHCAAIYALGGRVARLRLSAVGAELTLSAARPMGTLAQMLSALAGPLTNLALALVCAGWGEGWYLFIGLNLSLAAFNLLPVSQLDGGRALYGLLTLLWSEHGAARVMEVLSVVTVTGLMLGGIALFLSARILFTLPLVALWLALSLKPQKKGKKERFLL